MTTREKINADLDMLDEAGLREVRVLLKQLVKTHKSRKKRPGNGLAALRNIKIQGPPDWSRNLDLYLSGEKRLEDNLPGHAVRRRPRKRA